MKEIVIKIPDEAKEAFDNAENNGLKGGFYDHGGVIASAIRNGKVLPKGHGRLIDVDALENYIKEDADEWDEYALAYVENAPTIIEADEESDE